MRLRVCVWFLCLLCVCAHLIPGQVVHLPSCVYLPSNYSTSPPNPHLTPSGRTSPPASPSLRPSDSLATKTKCHFSSLCRIYPIRAPRITPKPSCLYLPSLSCKPALGDKTVRFSRLSFSSSSSSKNKKKSQLRGSSSSSICRSHSTTLLLSLTGPLSLSSGASLLT